MTGETFKIVKFKGEKHKKKKNFKFNLFGFNQIILLFFRKTKEVIRNGKKYKTTIKLNLVDLQLLQWFYDFQNTKKRE